MRFLEQEEKEFVRIIIGVGTTRKSGIKAPTKTITIQDTSVSEIHGLIVDIIKKENDKSVKESLKTKKRKK